MKLSVQHIANIVDGTLFGTPTGLVSEILIDSRSKCTPENTIFFALTGPHHNGHQYIGQLHQKGIRCFVVDQQFDVASMEATFIQVQNTLYALQDLASHYRTQFKGTLIGITGSNGKTVVKEWATQILSQIHSVIRSPKSYNSQVGVPLSLLLL